MSAERKRPWYLVLALLGALALGTTGACSGWGTVMLYREPEPARLLVNPSLPGVTDPADRAAIESRVAADVRTLDAAKPRGWPVAVGTLLLGTAVLFFAMRALGGSRGARAALVQLVVAQAGLSVLGYWLTRDVLDADVRLTEAIQAAGFHEKVPDRPQADEMSRTAATILRVASPIALALRSLGSILVVVALTRRRARDFFDASAAAVQER